MTPMKRMVLYFVAALALLAIGYAIGTRRKTHVILTMEDGRFNWITGVDSMLPGGMLGYPLGFYLEIEGRRTTSAGGTPYTIVVDKINGKQMQPHIPIEIENVDQLPIEEPVILRGYETGHMAGIPERVYGEDNIQLHSSQPFHFVHSFRSTRVITPSSLKINK
jgi:hypothetical protein